MHSHAHSSPSNLRPRFAHLPPDIVAKHGHRIRIVRNAASSRQVTILNNSAVNNLRDLRLKTTDSTEQHMSGQKIVARNNTSLDTLFLLGTTTFTNKRDSLVRHVFTSALIPLTVNQPLQSPPSTLKMLAIQNVCLTHDGLMSILQGSPSLTEVRLPGTDLIGRRSTAPFQHTGVTHLTIWSSNIGESVHDSTLPNTLLPSSPSSVLAYFPSLACLHIANPIPRTASSFDTIMDQTSQHCPNLTGFGLYDYSGAIVTRYCRHFGRNISELTFDFLRHSADSITAILLHRATLKRVKVFGAFDGVDLEADKVAWVAKASNIQSGSVQAIPRGCPLLEELGLYVHEMDMDEVEIKEWACKDLKTLRIRIKGLDTKDKILRVIELVAKRKLETMARESRELCGDRRRGQGLFD